MAPFDIFIACVAWDGGSKLRPVLVFGCCGEELAVFKLTTRFEGKGEAVRSKFYKIAKWQKAGLEKQSYVDTNTVRILPKKAWVKRITIGRLTEVDVRGLLEFLMKQEK